MSKTQAPPETGPRSAPEMIVTKEQYAQAFRQLDAEASYTTLAALLVTIVFWLTIFLTNDLTIEVWHLPLWFVLSCLGGYVFSVVVVIALVKLFLKPCALKVSSLKQQSLPSSEQLLANACSSAATSSATISSTTASVSTATCVAGSQSTTNKSTTDNSATNKPADGWASQAVEGDVNAAGSSGATSGAVLAERDD